MALIRRRKRKNIREKAQYRPGDAERQGYGREHRQLRKQVKPQVEAGWVTCWRCGKLIQPGEPWDLGHDDVDRSIYRGAEHAKCNRGTAGRVSQRRSRDW